MGSAPLKIIQISDIHLLAEEEGALLGVKTQASFQAVIDLVKKENNKPDLVILSGDLSQDGSDASYKRLAELIKVLEVPTYCVPGNHDNTKVMAHVFPRDMISAHRHIILQNWHIILLNSQKTNAVEGHLDQSQLNYLQHCLQAYPAHHAIILLHHHPMPVGCEWLDNLGLQNADEFWKIVERYPRVNTVLFGHVHQEFAQKRNKINCYSVPSTCIQFKCHQDQFGLEKLPPGFRWINLYDDGHIETGIKRVTEYVGEFDVNAKGY